MRTMVVKSGQTLAEASASLIDSRVNKAAADAALKRIVALNPTLATGKLNPGTIVVVPGGPGIKTAPTNGANDEPKEALKAEFERSARETRARLAAAVKARDEERAELAAVFDSNAFKRALAADRDLAAKADLARKSLTEDEAADHELAGTFDGLITDARAALEKLDKLAG